MRGLKHWSINPQIIIWSVNYVESFFPYTRYHPSPFPLKLLQAQRNGSHLDPISWELDITARGLTVLLSINRRNHRVILTSADVIWKPTRHNSSFNGRSNWYAGFLLDICRCYNLLEIAQLTLSLFHFYWSCKTILLLSR